MEMGKGTLIFDIDGTICSPNRDYKLAKPYFDVIDKINQKYEEGYTINFYTARGTLTGKDWTKITIEQLEEWGVKYHNLFFGKPAGDLYIDDKGINIDDWEQTVESENSIDKTWGKEYLLKLTDKYAFKRLEINPKCAISKQFHKIKEETWHIIEGYGIALIGQDAQWVKPGMTIHIPPKTIHKIKATDNNKIILIEVSTPELNDIVRMS